MEVKNQSWTDRGRTVHDNSYSRNNHGKIEADKCIRWKKGDAGELEMENIPGKVVEDKFR